jgi:hypothetical protein
MRNRASYQEQNEAASLRRGSGGQAKLDAAIMKSPEELEHGG